MRHDWPLDDRGEYNCFLNVILQVGRGGARWSGLIRDHLWFLWEHESASLVLSVFPSLVSFVRLCHHLPALSFLTSMSYSSSSFSPPRCCPHTRVVAQSLWHLRGFRDGLLSVQSHTHVGTPCVLCALQGIFRVRGRRGGGGKCEAG